MFVYSQSMTTKWDVEEKVFDRLFTSNFFMAPNQPNSTKKTSRTTWTKHHKEVTFSCHKMEKISLIRVIQTKYTSAIVFYG
jgi:hypothetical protein